MKKKRTSESCIACILEKQEKNIQMVPDEVLREKYRSEIMQTIEQRPDTDSAPVIVSKLTVLAEKYLGKTDIYGPIKQKYNRIMLELSSEIRRYIEKAPDPLAQAIVFARAGNFIDFGAMHEVNDDIMHALLDEAVALKPDPEVYQVFLHELAGASRLVYLTDNCGEIVLDRLLIEQIRKRFPQVSVTVIVRGNPVINDATMEDAREAGLVGLPGITVIGNGTSIAGTELTMISEGARREIDGADVIISKGQGNFETLHGCGLNIYYLFLCKCDWFSQNLDLPKLGGVFEREDVLLRRWKAG